MSKILKKRLNTPLRGIIPKQTLPNYKSIKSILSTNGLNLETNQSFKSAGVAFIKGANANINNMKKYINKQ